MSELGPEARDLLDAAREADLPTDFDRRRVRTALLAKIAAGTAIGASATAASSSAAAAGGTAVASSGSAMLAVKIAAAVALVGGGVAVPIVAMRSERALDPPTAIAARETSRTRETSRVREALRARETTRGTGEAAVHETAESVSTGASGVAVDPAAASVGGANAPSAVVAPSAPPSPSDPASPANDVVADAPSVDGRAREPLRVEPAVTTRTDSRSASSVRAPRPVAPRVRNPIEARETRPEVAQIRGGRATRQTVREQTSIAPPPATLGRTQPEPSELASEATILRSALASIRDGRPEQAVEQLDRHAEAHPEGVLAQERVAARIRALCAMGRTGDADAARATFLRRWPTSPLAARVRSGCVR